MTAQHAHAAIRRKMAQRVAGKETLNDAPIGANQPGMPARIEFEFTRIRCARVYAAVVNREGNRRRSSSRATGNRLKAIVGTTVYSAAASRLND